MIINEQIRKYNEKMVEIEQLEYAEALAVNQLKLKRQNTVRSGPRDVVIRLCLILYGLLIPWQQHTILIYGSSSCLDVKELHGVTQPMFLVSL